MPFAHSVEPVRGNKGKKWRCDVVSSLRLFEAKQTQQNDIKREESSRKQSGASRASAWCGEGRGERGGNVVKWVGGLGDWIVIFFFSSFPFLEFKGYLGQGNLLFDDHVLLY